jgi:hypothetical protein
MGKRRGRWRLAGLRPEVTEPTCFLTEREALSYMADRRHPPNPLTTQRPFLKRSKPLVTRLYAEVHA